MTSAAGQERILIGFTLNYAREMRDSLRRLPEGFTTPKGPAGFWITIFLLNTGAKKLFMIRFGNVFLY